MTRYDVPVTVVGAGVSGLTTGVLLAETGHRLRLLTADRPAATTSWDAGAIWGPHLVDHPNVAAWAQRSLETLTDLSARGLGGVEMVTGVEASRVAVPRPDWLTAVGRVTDRDPSLLPEGFAVGWEYRVPIIDMPAYLTYLVDRLGRAGVEVEVMDEPITPEDLPGLGPVVVNCTGMGARELVGDTSLVPVRGDLVVVHNPGVTEFFAEHTDEWDAQTYVLPQGDRVVLGGTATEHDESRTADDRITAGILARCAAVEPLLVGAEPIEVRVGVRPARPSVRVEREVIGGTDMVHNYGHGGGGVSLSWGCAAEVVAMVAAIGADRAPSDRFPSEAEATQQSVAGQAAVVGAPPAPVAVVGG